ncbi:MAG: adenylate/guanylate cyclase domain-containing protein [Planctomycetes bacterium]|nr:adenylate/guanylate cyclase domain-containing protein [Planctomycetota bacterium]
MPARKELPRPVQALLTGAGVAAFVGLLQLSGLLELWELKTRDLRTNWTLRAPRKESDPFVRPDLFLIDVTDASLQKMDEQLRKMNKPGLWPWPREIQADFINACARAKATVVLYDFILSEAGDPEDQKYMVQAIQAGPPCYLAGGFREISVSAMKEGPEHEALLKKTSIEVVNDGSVSIPDRYTQVILPSAPLSKAAAGVCDISTPRDRDKIIRRYRLFSTFQGRTYPSFVLAALMAREKASKVRVHDRLLSVGSLTLPVESDGSVLIRYYPTKNVPAPFAWRSAWNVLNDEDARPLEGKTVVVGTSAVGLTDLREAPTDLLAGPVIHLTALSNVLNGEFLRESPKWISVLLFSILALGVALSTRLTSAALGGGVAAGVLAGSVGLSTAFYGGRWIVDLVPQMLAVVLAYAATSAVNFLHEGRKRLEVKRIFGQYVSKKVVDKILQHSDALHLEGERKPLTIFFMDFAGFTAMSEKLDPSELVKLISEYHNEAAEEIFKTEGTLDKFIGDAIMAYWNDPIEQPDHALRACLTAVGAQKKLLKMAELMKERGLPEMSARIGLNTGIATVGNMGSKEQVNYTLIGDEVNLASRLEGVNKEFGTKVIISEATYLPAKERLEVRELALIKVKGKKLPVRIFELIALKGEAAPERMETVRKFEAALLDFRARKFNKAWELFLSLAQKGDPASEVYVGLCEAYMNEPPHADWDGSYQMEHK